MSRDKFIRYLNSLPTIKSDNKINKVLKNMKIDD